ncbi:MAG: glycosyltransferase family 4 protein [bacterium]|nr:glycosyltransferase family 4 protein [bacterium]
MKPKVFFFKFPLIDSLGGGEHYVLYQAKYLKSQGFEIKLITSDRNLFRLFEKNYLPRKRIFAGWEPTSKWSMLLWPVTYLVAKKRFKKVLAQIPRDSIVFCQSLVEKLILTPLTLNPSPSGRGAGVRIIWLEHKIPGNWLKLNPLKFRYLQLAKKIQVVTVSNSARAEFVKLGVPEENITVVYPSPSPVLRPLSPRVRVEGVRIGILSRLDPEKGVLDFLKLIIPTLKNHPAWQIIIGGEGEEKIEIQSLIDTNYLAGRIKLLGFVNNLDEFFSRVTVFACPSKTPESFGISVLEAMARAVPVIASKIGALPEIIEHGKNGFLVTNSQDWAEYIKKLEDKTLYSQMSLWAVKRANLLKTDKSLF